MDKGLRREYLGAGGVSSDFVSILGLVDKGLRHGVRQKLLPSWHVSILGLVDKGLRLKRLFISIAEKLGFNPWFSG